MFHQDLLDCWGWWFWDHLNIPLNFHRLNISLVLPALQTRSFGCTLAVSAIGKTCRPQVLHIEVMWNVPSCHDQYGRNCMNLIHISFWPCDIPCCYEQQKKSNVAIQHKSEDNGHNVIFFHQTRNFSEFLYQRESPQLFVTNPVDLRCLGKMIYQCPRIWKSKKTRSVWFSKRLAPHRPTERITAMKVCFTFVFHMFQPQTCSFRVTCFWCIQSTAKKKLKSTLLRNPKH